MNIEQTLTTKLKNAMKSRNQKEISVIRMVKSEATNAKTASGFNAETNDTFWLDIITRYVKQQKKAIVEFAKLGDQGKEQVESLNYEIDYLMPFLPQMLGESDIEVLVDKAIAETKGANAKMIGRIIGAVMKDNKGNVDATIVKKIVSKKLG